jgi:hypothetical protein
MIDWALFVGGRGKAQRNSQMAIIVGDLWVLEKITASSGHQKNLRSGAGTSTIPASLYGVLVAQASLCFHSRNSTLHERSIKHCRRFLIW